MKAPQVKFCKGNQSAVELGKIGAIVVQVNSVKRRGGNCFELTVNDGFDQSLNVFSEIITLGLKTLEERNHSSVFPRSLAVGRSVKALVVAVRKSHVEQRESNRASVYNASINADLSIGRVWDLLRVDQQEAAMRKKQANGATMQTTN